MGSDLSSCCSVEQGSGKEVVKDEDQHTPKTAAAHTTTTTTTTNSAYSRTTETAASKLPATTDVEKFQRRLENKINVVVLLADGQELPCWLQYHEDSKSFEITCDTNARVIALTELKAVLHGQSQLRRVETKAKIHEETCVALHMETGNCIPMRFPCAEEKQCFVELVKKLKAKNPR